MKRLLALVLGFALVGCASTPKPAEVADVAKAVPVPVPATQPAKSDADINLNELLSTVSLAPYPSETRREGFLIQHLEDTSDWQKVGFRKGDVIVAVDGKPVIERASLIHLVRAVSNPGSARIEVLRAQGKKMRRQTIALPVPVEEEN